jgi:hypothetical protein
MFRLTGAIVDGIVSVDRPKTQFHVRKTRLDQFAAASVMPKQPLELCA